MKLLRHTADHETHLAIVVNQTAVTLDLLDCPVNGRGATADPLDVFDLPEAERQRLEQAARDVLADDTQRGEGQRRGLVGPVTALDLLAPVVAPSKIVCLALNYRSHADEGGFRAPGRPVGFIKGAHTLTGDRSTVVVPTVSTRVDYEGELAVVIGRSCRDVAEQDWRDVVAGYSVLNDLTARDLQLEDIAAAHPWDLTKNLDGFAPMGPWLCSADEVPDPQDVRLQVRVDGEVRQQGTTASMIFDVAALIAYLSSLMTLERGDVIATGTCDGIGPVPHGSTVEVDLGPTLGRLSTVIIHQAAAGAENG